ncbi:ABC transporter ATP-binding protein [Pseudodesulfovibrio tunisiensis]|uniref:ABC transporter ATP-binding protein n=1 Tax=Pseudodesulfovibrio tunisiensis TaxID=463192 RepID=UPI001FB4AC67|nr:ABC transporter ATP-binding protein [Pseudodesulfovibrio tunisiensis]
MGLELVNVNKTVAGEVHLADVDLTLDSGSRYVILGRTLAGKTSLMRIMAGLDRPSSGKVVADGEDVTGVSVRKRSVAMVYQQFINYPSLKIYDNIASPLKIAGASKPEIDRRVREASAMLHLDDMLDRLPAELSGGQQQRCAIARALVKDVNLLLLDEPLVNLDYKLREELRDELQIIFSQRQSVVVYSTTEPTEALMLGGHIVVMDKGRILQTGTTSEVYLKPATMKVAEVFSDPPINFIRADVADNRAHLRIGLDFPLSGHLSELQPGTYQFGIRPHHFNLDRQTPEDICIESMVELSEINGSETFLHFHYRNRSLVAHEQGVRSRKAGDSVTMYVRPCDFYVFNEEGNLVLHPERD